MKSRDLASFRAALAEQFIPRWNFLYTDASNLYWVHNGLVARRNGSFEKGKPIPGWTHETEWGPYLPFSANPQLENPSSGFLQNCNNPPWVVTRNSGLKPLAPSPYYLSDAVLASSGEEVLNPRGERLSAILARPQGGFTVDEFTALNFDTYVLAADVFVPLLLEAAGRRQPIKDTGVSHAIELLRKWDRRSSEDSAAYTYVHYFADAYRRLPWPFSFDRFSRFQRNRIDIHSRIEQFAAWWAFEKAVDRVESLYGRRDVPWGTVNGVLRGTWLPVGGTADFDVLHPDRGRARSDGRVYCDDGWGHILVAMEGEPKQVWTLLPYGESESPRSPHYADQAQLHSRQQLKRFWITPAEILANTESVWGDRGRLKRAAPTAVRPPVSRSAAATHRSPLRKSSPGTPVSALQALPAREKTEPRSPGLLEK
jgi:acyl-homoserine lactone acylase PvdQ